MAQQRELKKIRIPEEYVQLDPNEIAVTQTRTFQRLYGLKQLGLAYMVYPSATHTRGVHSLQCLHEATKILDAIGVTDEDPDQASVVRMAALLHDIGHIPFSHTLEDEHIVIDKKHDKPERLDVVLGLLKHELSVTRPEAIKVIDAAMPVLLAIAKVESYDQDWRSDTVGNTISADLLAYITPDAMWTGIEKRPGYYPIYDYFIRQQDRLCIKLTKAGLRTDIVSAIMDILDMRYALTERVLFHHAKCVASAMLARSARLLGIRDGSNLLEIGMGDDAFLDYLEQLARDSQNEGAAQMLSNLRSRRLYKRIFKVGRLRRDAWDQGRTPEGTFCATWRDREKVENLLCSAEDTHGLSRGALALWCPEKEASMKLARANVVWESGDHLEGPVHLRSKEIADIFPGVHNRVDTMEQQYFDLWTFWVSIDRANLDQAAAVVKTLEQLMDVECDRVFRETYLRPRVPGYGEGETRVNAITRTFQKLLPDIDRSISQQAALDRNPHLDDASILAATGKLVEKRIKPRPRKRPEPQLELIRDERDLAASDEENSGFSG